MLLNYLFHRRRPSWTDRILYKVNAIDIYNDVELKAEQHTYKSHPNYSVSDHKPVTGEFDIAVKRYSLLYISMHCLIKYEWVNVLQVRPNVSNYIVEFQECRMEENFVSYKLQRNITPSNGDWIGLFLNDFSSLDDYIIYEYVSRGKLYTPLYSIFKCHSGLFNVF